LQARIAARLATLLILVTVWLTACDGTTAAEKPTPSGSAATTVACIPPSNTSPAGQQLTDADKAAVAAVCDWLQMFASTQSYVSNQNNPDGTQYAATAIIAISDIAKVGGHAITAMDIADGAASANQAYIVTAFKLHDNARTGAVFPYPTHVPDINATVELRQIAVTISPSESLTSADQADGVTFRGSVGLTFISHYAFEGFTPNPFQGDRFTYLVVFRNGQTQLRDASGYSSMAGGTGTTIRYPADAFTSVEKCVSQYSDPRQCIATG
jgi:hypothetical protein